MSKWFYSLPRLAQIILLLIPGVNWVIEVVVRWSAFLNKGGLLRLIFAVVVSVCGLVFGWVDLVWTALFGHMIFASDY